MEGRASFTLAGKVRYRNMSAGWEVSLLPLSVLMSAHCTDPGKSLHSLVPQLSHACIELITLLFLIKCYQIDEWRVLLTTSVLTMYDIYMAMFYYRWQLIWLLC